MFALVDGLCSSPKVSISSGPLRAERRLVLNEPGIWPRVLGVGKSEEEPKVCILLSIGPGLSMQYDASNRSSEDVEKKPVSFSRDVRVRGLA
jgi:hypothetical protein